MIFLVTPYESLQEFKLTVQPTQREAAHEKVIYLNKLSFRVIFSFLFFLLFWMEPFSKELLKQYQ